MKCNILYAGYNIETLNLLVKDEELIIKGAGDVEYFSEKTFNPVNLIFKAVYRLRVKNKFRIFEITLFYLWIALDFLSTSAFRRYRNYLKTLSKNKIKVLDFENKEKIIDFIKTEKVDLLVVNVWGMLEKEIIYAPKFGSLNVHPSKLPQYRGALPTLWSLKNKDQESAVSYMILEESMDTGKIVNQHSFPISADDDWFSLEMKISGILKNTIVQDIKDYLNGKIIPLAQDNEKVSYTGKYYECKKINWEEEVAVDIYNKVNLYPFLEFGVYCYFKLGEKKIFIKRAFLSENLPILSELNPGEISVKGIGVFIGAKSGIIKSRLFLDFSFKDSLGLIKNFLRTR